MTRSQLVLCVLLVFGAAAPVQADDPPASAQLPVLPAPADPDTVQVEVQLPQGFPPVREVAVKPDTLLVGRPATLILTFDAEAELPPSPADSLGFSQPWLYRDGPAAFAAQRPGVLQIPVRVFQINPFQVSAGEQTTAVLLVDLASESTQETAAVRDPRRWGWNLWTLFLGAALITGVLLLCWWLWTARKVAIETLPDWPVQAPAWIAAATALDQLLTSGALERGEARTFLDQQAALTRRYLAGRFRIGAVEMTPPEIRRACRALAHPTGDTEPFLEVLEGLDHRRYDPDPADTEFCRHMAWCFHVAMARVRILPLCTPVDAEVLRAGEAAWARNSAVLEQFKGSLPAEFAPPVARGDA